MAVYSELCYPTALRGVAFHPHEHLVAFCAFGQNQAIYLYVYDQKGKFVCLQVIYKRLYGIYTMGVIVFWHNQISRYSISSAVQMLGVNSPGCLCAWWPVMVLLLCVQHLGTFSTY